MTEETTAAEATGAEEEVTQEAEPSMRDRIAGIFKGRGSVRSSVLQREDADAERAQAAEAEAAAQAEADDGADDVDGEGDGTDEAEGDSADNTPPSRKRNRNRSAKIRDLRDDVSGHKEEIARLKGQVEALREVKGIPAADQVGGEGEGTQPQADSAQDDAEPEMDAYDSVPEYVKAQARWEVRQEMREQQEQAAAEKTRLTQQTEHVELVKSWEGQLSKGRERWADFDSVALSSEVPLSATMLERITHSEFGAELAYNLGRNPTEAAHIAQQDSLVARDALAVMEADIRAARIAFPDTNNTQDDAAAGSQADADTSTAAGAGATRRPRAATPPSEVRGNERPEPNLDKLSKDNPAEYARVRNKQRAAARE